MVVKGIIHIQYYHSPCGELALGSSGDSLCLCNWVDEKHPGQVERRLFRELNAVYADGITDVIRMAARELDEYFAGERQKFDVPLLFAGSEFQKSVWQRLTDIPYGETMSYGELSATLGAPRSVRAVANANGANAISIFVPCHRVVGCGGALTGYGGGIEAKRFLLELERGVSGRVRN